MFTMTTNQTNEIGLGFWVDDSNDSNAAVNGHLGHLYGSEQANDPNFWMQNYQEQQNAAFTMPDFQVHRMNLEGQMSQLSTVDSMVPHTNSMNSMAPPMNSTYSMSQMDSVDQTNHTQSDFRARLPSTYIVPAPQIPPLNIVPEAAKKKRELTSIACGPCKKSHLRCDAKQPICLQCIQRQRDPNERRNACVYDLADDKRRKAGLRKTIASLKERVNTLETIVELRDKRIAELETALALSGSSSPVSEQDDESIGKIQVQVDGDHK